MSACGAGGRLNIIMLRLPKILCSHVAPVGECVFSREAGERICVLKSISSDVSILNEKILFRFFLCQGNGSFLDRFLDNFWATFGSHFGVTFEAKTTSTNGSMF